jgi:hypothetical protein
MQPPMVEQARAAAQRAYAHAHDRFAEREQMLMLEGNEVEAAGARVYAQRVLRAWLAERDDPEPDEEDA